MSHGYNPLTTSLKSFINIVIHASYTWECTVFKMSKISFHKISGLLYVHKRTYIHWSKVWMQDKSVWHIQECSLSGYRGRCEAQYLLESPLYYSLYPNPSHPLHPLPTPSLSPSRRATDYGVTRTKVALEGTHWNLTRGFCLSERFPTLLSMDSFGPLLQ